jgi:hypothetical protein
MRRKGELGSAEPTVSSALARESNCGERRERGTATDLIQLDPMRLGDVLCWRESNF